VVLDADRAARLRRALVSLQGLSVGDAFGESFFGPPDVTEERLATRRLAARTWPWTDDTAMALSVVDVLASFDRVDPDALAEAFGRRHAAQPDRGYGAGARQILTAIAGGVGWTVAATLPFGAEGSHGNGGAMRAGPVGAYFADDLERVVEEARASATVTHLHPEGQAGAVAVALAAAYAVRWRSAGAALHGQPLLDFVVGRTPPGPTRFGLEKARAMPPDASVAHAAAVLGTGQNVSAADTVPFSLWVAARHLDSFEEALWTTVSGLGDRDTTCAIAGSIVASSAGPESIPPRWLASREKLGSPYDPAAGGTDG